LQNKKKTEKIVPTIFQKISLSMNKYSQKIFGSFFGLARIEKKFSRLASKKGDLRKSKRITKNFFFRVLGNKNPIFIPF